MEPMWPKKPLSNLPWLATTVVAQGEPSRTPRMAYQALG